METKTEAMEKAQYDVNVAKERLLRICYQLEEAGAIRKAKSLYTIVGRLEQWQNTK